MKKPTEIFISKKEFDLFNIECDSIILKYRYNTFDRVVYESILYEVRQLFMIHFNVDSKWNIDRERVIETSGNVLVDLVSPKINIVYDITI